MFIHWFRYTLHVFHICFLFFFFFFHYIILCFHFLFSSTLKCNHWFSLISSHSLIWNSYLSTINNTYDDEKCWYCDRSIYEKILVNCDSHFSNKSDWNIKSLKLPRTFIIVKQLNGAIYFNCTTYYYDVRAKCRK